MEVRGIVRNMVTGDQDKQVHVRMKGGDAGTADAPGQSGYVEIEPVRCSCEWITMDTGNAFYSRISKPDPDCAAHRR